MSRKTCKKTSSRRWLNNLLRGLIMLKIIITIFVGGNDYHISTAIQVSNSCNEILKTPVNLLIIASR